MLRIVGRLALPASKVCVCMHKMWHRLLTLALDGNSMTEVKGMQLLQHIAMHDKLSCKMFISAACILASQRSHVPHSAQHQLNAHQALCLSRS